MYIKLVYALKFSIIPLSVYLIGYYASSCEFSHAQTPLDTHLDSLIELSLADIYQQWYYDDYPKAFEAYDTLAQYAQKSQRWVWYLQIMNDQTFLTLFHDDFPKALQLNQKGLAAFKNYAKEMEKPEADEIQSALLYSKCYLEFESGDFEACLATSKDRLKYLPDEDSINQTSTYRMIAYASRHLHRYDEAIQYFEASIRYLPKGSDNLVFNYDYGNALRLGNIGETYLAKFLKNKYPGQAQQARKYMQRSIQTLENHRHWLISQNILDKDLFNALSSQYRSLAMFYKETRQYDSAYYYLDKSKLFLKNELNTIKLALLEGDVCHADQRYEQAIQAYEEAFQISEKFHSKLHPTKALALQKMGEVYFTQESYAQAIRQYQLAIFQLDSTFQFNRNLAVNPHLDKVIWNQDLLQILVLKARAFHHWAKQNGWEPKKLQIAQQTYHWRLNWWIKSGVAIQPRSTRPW
ncbi:MAG: tetratricopeptide repeat protein [Bacteroidia bacterium]|nr:tetratricopeptide repeat protein [Bacteroidia bacterium]